MTGRGLLTTDDLRERCTVDKSTRCWNWTGATTSKGTPRMHTFDHATGEKRVMSGPLAAWNIAHQAAPLSGHLVFRCCGNRACLNPVHLKEAKDKRAIFDHVKRAGWRKGTQMEQRRAAQKLAMAANGIVPTADAIVIAIRAADPAMTNKALAERHGIAHQTVSMIRLGKSHRHLLEAA